MDNVILGRKRYTHVGSSGCVFIHFTCNGPHLGCHHCCREGLDPCLGFSNEHAQPNSGVAATGIKLHVGVLVFDCADALISIRSIAWFVGE